MPCAYLIELQIDIIILAVYTLFRREEKHAASSLTDAGHNNESRVMDWPVAGLL